MGDALVEVRTPFGLETGRLELDRTWPLVVSPLNPRSGIWDLVFHCEDWRLVTRP